MRILHLCLACFYIDGYNYQENVLPRINAEDGNDVMIIASTETYTDNKKLGFVKPGEYVTEYGVPIKRIPYKYGISLKMRSKLRFYKDLYKEIDSFNPDVIMAHDLCFGSVIDVCKYIKKHSNVVFYADTHTTEYNSGKNWISLNILHRMYYRYMVRKAMPFVSKYFYITKSEKDFSLKHYGISSEKMEFLPLGGELLSDEEYETSRADVRNEFEITDDAVLFANCNSKLNTDH